MSGIDSSSGRQALLGDGLVSPDGTFGADDRSALLGEQFSSGLDGKAKLLGGDKTMRIQSHFLNGMRVGGTGKISFQFRLHSMNETSLLATVELSDMVIGIENRADKTYMDLIGENNVPVSHPDNEDDDTDVA